MDSRFRGRPSQSRGASRSNPEEGPSGTPEAGLPYISSPEAGPSGSGATLGGGVWLRVSPAPPPVPRARAANNARGLLANFNTD